MNFSFENLFPTFHRAGGRALSALHPRGWLTWRNARRASATLAAVGTVAGLFYAVENWRGRRAWDKAMQEARERGIPTRLADLAPQSVPDVDNAARAPIMVELAARANDRDPQWERRWRLEPAGPVKANYPGSPGLPSPPMYSSRDVMDGWRAYLGVADLRDYFEPRAQDMERFAEAARRPYLVWDTPGESVSVDWRAVMRGYVGLSRPLPLFVLRAGWRLENFDSAGAAEDILTLLRVAILLKQEGFGVPMGELAVNPAIDLIRVGLKNLAWDTAQLAAFERHLAGLDDLGDVVRGLRDQAALTAFFLKSASGTPAELVETETLSRTEALWMPAGWVMQNAAALPRFYEEQVLACFDLKRRCADLTHLRELEALPSSGFEPYRMLVSRQVRRVPPVVVWEIRTLARVGQARIALALERWRWAHGEYPATLTELPAEWGVSDLRDPVNGEPFRYARAKAGWFKYQLYSVGADGRDGGGAPCRDPFPVWQTGDWVW
jgi:hypothetical protein